ncbi:methylated-DNA--[protein]-cysteine S-methyltransferase [Hansschlegelia zhihuaiae]|uniref:Methylated-DNA--protein-cysteine methyltransferase n=1 Tax=Hansschlegelia zhihuaiae TaxID=405005 RepID=A0A4V1KIA3_9HYPH|nr:methylated-DNA--[protein]-cysteine S-methyltransferase [Hansschlegelia zhihuaiae]RXF69992.1 methylated-DNA--[protein]-cysteine S-methyltransferase [Hansschlegelia zhihuaiae]
MTLARKRMASPVGELSLVASETGLEAILWRNDDPKRVRLGPVVDRDDHPLLLETERQLADYFAGNRRSFELNLDPSGTPFQRGLWKALAAIPFGETRSYGQLAAELGNPKAVRAVGAANGRNPISIVVPCHRVIGVSGDLTGFAGGLEAKAFLLKLEARSVGAGERRAA